MNVPMRRPLVAFLSGALVVAGAEGCATTARFRHQSPLPGSSDGSFVEVTVRETPHGEPAGRAVEWQLSRLESGELQPVHRSEASTWYSPPLPPGKYAIEVLGWEKPGGGHVALRQGSITKRFALRERDFVTADVVLRDSRPAIRGGVGLVVVLGILYAVLSASSWSPSGSALGK